MDYDQREALDDVIGTLYRVSGKLLDLDEDSLASLCVNSAECLEEILRNVET